MVAGIRRRLDELRPAVVCINGWSYGGCFAALEWCLEAKVPAVVMSDSTGLEAADNDRPARRRWWKEAVKRRVVALCGAALVAGRPHARYLSSLGMCPSAVFDGYDVVDNAHFAAGADRARAQAPALRRRLGLPERYVLTAGRHVPVKNLDGLLEAYALFVRQTRAEPPWLVVLGDGPERARLQQRAAELRIAGRVRWPGHVGYADLPAHYGLAETFVLPSHAETWGLVVNEAMAAGLPVLVSDRCGCAEDLVVPGRNGFTFAPGDTAALAGLLARLAASAETRARMGQAGRALVAAWSPERFAQGLARAVAAARAAPPPQPGPADRLLLKLLRRR
jgi:glycosyltransferase involved in cell wall biosynthesis